MGLSGMKDCSLPSADLLEAQARWLYPARSRLLRRIGIAHKERVLDLGAGYGMVTGELTRRSGGYVMALDLNPNSLHEIETNNNLFRIAGNSAKLPFKSETFDLAFCQCALLWMAPIESTILEVKRALVPSGTLLAIEPDYEGLIEWPQSIATRHLWLAALNRSGADPAIGRKLPVYLTNAGFDVSTYLLDRLDPPSPLRFEFLKDLPLTQSETRELHEIITKSTELGPAQQTVHLPFFLILATKK